MTFYGVHVCIYIYIYVTRCLIVGRRRRGGGRSIAYYTIKTTGENEKKRNRTVRTQKRDEIWPASVYEAGVSCRPSPPGGF